MKLEEILNGPVPQFKGLYPGPTDSNNKSLLMSNKCVVSVLQEGFFFKISKNILFQQEDPQEVLQELWRWPGGKRIRKKNQIVSKRTNLSHSLYLISA